MLQLWSLRTRPACCNKRSRHSEKPARCHESSPCSPQRARQSKAVEIQDSPKEASEMGRRPERSSGKRVTSHTLYRGERERLHSETAPAGEPGMTPLNCQGQSCEPRVLQPRKTPFQERKHRERATKGRRRLPLHQKERNSRERACPRAPESPRRAVRHPGETPQVPARWGGTARSGAGEAIL